MISGGISSNGSGDYVIAFSTANKISYRSDSPVDTIATLRNDQMSSLFLAVIEATEEAIINSLFTAETTLGNKDHKIEKLPIEKVLNVMKKQIGILGGMGPEATSELFSLIIKNTKAYNDQDHIPVLIVNNPKIPDRAMYIMDKGPSPVKMLVEGALKLEQMGADIILIPCNTAHFFLKQIKEKIHVPIIDMIKETARYVLIKYPEIKRYGLLTTSGVYKTAIYKEAFEDVALEIINPDVLYQQQNMTAIYGINGIKAGFKTIPGKILHQSVANLEKKGAGAIISGCTEISLVLEQPQINIPLINPLKILAEKSIQLAGYSLSKSKKSVQNCN